MDKQLCDFASLKPTGVADAGGDTGFDPEDYPDLPASTANPDGDDDEPRQEADQAGSRPRRVVYMTDLRQPGGH
jgi:tRNA 2-thiocytidine biosynthesis protein TtcA